MSIVSKIGFGAKVSGEAVIFKDGVRSSELTFDLEGKILIFLDTPSRELLEKAKLVGVLGVVVPSIHFRDYNYFRSSPDFAMMVVQRFGNSPLADEEREKILKFNGVKVVLDGDRHELKID